MIPIHDLGWLPVDISRAVFMNYAEASVAQFADGDSLVSLILAGHVHGTSDHASALFLFGTDGVAMLITELLALMERETGVNPSDMINDLVNRVKQLREDESE